METSIPIAMQALNAAVAKSKEKQRLTDTAGLVASHLVLVKLQTISTHVAEKLSRVMRESLKVLYTSVGVPAMQLASTILQSVYHERLLPAIGDMQVEQQQLWELVLHSLLAGVLDHLDDHTTKTAKDAIGSALYRSLCEVCFSLTAPKTSVDLRCTAYNILCDSAASHQENQDMLRDPDVLGGERLGSCIWRTRDYLAMEGLLNLFARALPSTQSSGRSQRTAYIHSVFKSCVPPELVTTGAEIAELLEDVPTSNWEDTAVKIVHVLSKGSIAYPQPFSVTEVIACGERYPSDRLYADHKSFLADVLLGDDQYESLEVAYHTLNRIETSDLDSGEVRVTISMDEPARLGKEPVTIEDDLISPRKAVFVLKRFEADHFIEVLESRGLSHLIPERLKSFHAPKLSLAAEPANLELDGAGRLWKRLSQNERIENVAQFYKTDETSDDIISCESSEKAKGVVATPCSSPNPTAGDDQAVFEPISGPTPEERLGRNGTSITLGPSDNDSTHTSALAPLSRTGSHLARAAAAAFGLSDEELSEISDCDSPLPRSTILGRSSTAVSLVRGRIPFEIVLAKGAGTSSSATRVARGGAGKVILDSDDEPPRAALAPTASRRARKKAALVRDLTVDSQSIPVAAPAPISVPATTLSPAAPSTPSPLLGDDTLVSSNAPEKVTRFSEFPAPDFNAPLSSPAFVPKSILKSALAKKMPSSRLETASPLNLEATTDNAPAPLVIPTGETKLSALKTSAILNDLVPPSSSPTPGARKSIKASLRKKEEPQHVASKTAKRLPSKRNIAAVDDSEPLVALGNGTERVLKRPRTSTAPAASDPVAGQEDAKLLGRSPNGGLDSAVSRPRAATAARTTKKYHAKKARISSPAQSSVASPEKATSVNYDALPNPPRAAAATSKPAPGPKGKRSVKPRPKGAAKKEAPKKPKGAEVRDENNAVETINNSPEAPSSRKTRANARTPQQDSKAAQGLIGAAGPIHAPPVTGPEQPRRSTRRTLPTTSTAAVVNSSDVATDIVECTVPVDDSLSGDVVPLVFEMHGAEVFPTEHQVPETDRPSTEEAPRPVEVLGKAKKAPATPWDAAFDVDPAARTKVAAPETMNANTGVEDVQASADGIASPMVASGGEIIDLPHPAVKSIVSVPVLPTSAGTSIIKPAQEDAPLAPQRANTSSSNSPKNIRQVNDVPKNVSTPARVPQLVAKSSPAKVKKEVETIDLTVDSPKQIQRHSSPTRVREVQQLGVAYTQASTTVRIEEPKQKFAAANDNDSDILAFLERGRPPSNLGAEDVDRPVASLLGSGGDIGRHGDRRRQQGINRNPQLGRPCSSSFRVCKLTLVSQGVAYDASATRTCNAMQAAREGISSVNDNFRMDPPMHRIVEVLGRIHEAVVHNMENKFEGVRHLARLGRSELLRNAIADLHVLRAQSVAHFNQLVDLEAEYAAFGRGLMHGSEDWVKSNQELTQHLTEALEQHDRTMLSKKMPPNLMPSTL